MNLDPRLGRTDRIANVAVGAGVMAYALLGSFDQVWVRVFLLALGLVSAAGGIYGL